MSKPSTFAPGFSITDDLVVVAPLNQGGMGAVYVVEQKSTGKRRAVKVMHREIVANTSLLQRFEREARAGARIKSEHIVEVLGTGVEPTSGLPYLLMELLEGDDLGQYASAHGALAHDEVRAIFEQLCHGVGAAHAAGVVHRDLKPENVFLAWSRRAGGDRFTVKVLDFGIAKLAAEVATRATTGAVGSPMWMAPEQTAPGPVTPATDVWALGLIAYRLLTGENFWRSVSTGEPNTAQLMREIVLDPIPRASERALEQEASENLPPGFDAWFARAVAREPGERFANASELWKAMRSLFASDDALAKTELAPGGSLPPGPASATDPATPFAAGAPVTGGSTPRTAKSPDRALAATPIAAVQPTPAPGATPPASSRALVVAGVAIAIGGIAVGWAIAHGGTGPRQSQSRDTSSAAVTAPAATSAAASAPGARSGQSAASEAPLASSAPAASASASSAPERPGRAAPAAKRAASPAPAAHKSAADTASAKPKRHQPGVVWTVGNHRHVRLMAYLVSNQSNVSDGVVRKAVEWNSWQYLRCYEPLAGLKQLPEGTVTVGFDILDQLPRHAALQSSTIHSSSFDHCVVRTLVGQTINAAGPDGKGHVVYGFHFVPMD